MGCLSSKEEKEPPKIDTTNKIVDVFAERRAAAEKKRLDEEGNTESGEEANGKIVDPFAAKRATEKKDEDLYSFKNKEGMTLVRQEGELNGSGFNIANCKNCDIFILDHTAQILIDDCKNTRFFLGPCASSVFFRNCTNCKFVMACRQFRTRDSKNIDVLLYCKTRPTIESTTLRVGCFSGMSYFALAKQFEAAQLPVWTNPWTEFHDFTSAGGPHYEYLPPTTTAKDLLDFDKLFAAIPSLSPEEFDAPSPVPHTMGVHTIQPGGPRAFVAAFGGDAARKALDAITTAVQESEREYLIQTVELKLNRMQSQKLFGKAKAKALPDPKSTVVVGMEFAVEGPLGDRVREALKSLTPDNTELWVVTDDADKAIENFFSCRPDEQM